MALARSLFAKVDDEAFRAGVAQLAKRSQEQLLALWREKQFQGVLSATQVEGLLATQQTTIEQLLVDLLPLAKIYSRPPVSDFRVGAIARGKSGSLYFGANLETPPNILGCSVHAEQAATSNAFMAGESGIVDVAVNAAPCGHCRQFLHEMVGKQDIRIVMKSGVSPLADLLPSPFGPKNLGQSGNPFSRQGRLLRLAADHQDALTHKALDAATRAYAPYSKSPSGVAIRTLQGRIFSGSYIENVAFNPSLSPVLVAVTAMIRADEPIEAISEATLVEVDGAPISQMAMTRSVLEALGPKAVVKRITATG